jgi:DNA (cytosine-5)-methyltransferase 1
MSLPMQIDQLLPTPRVSDQHGTGVHGDGGLDLRTTIQEKLLPTTEAWLGRRPSSAKFDPTREASRHTEERGDRSVTLPEALSFDWGVYEPAIRRWERVMGAPSPNPVDDKGRLEPKFVEWMMGFPAGWTDTIKVRSHSLRALGNAVVPQQGAEALARLFAIAEATMTAPIPRHKDIP